jgi:hypothetical protein
MMVLFILFALNVWGDIDCEGRNCMVWGSFGRKFISCKDGAECLFSNGEPQLVIIYSMNITNFYLIPVLLKYRNSIHFVRFEFLTAIDTKIYVFWDIMRVVR